MHGRARPYLLTELFLESDAFPFIKPRERQHDVYVGCSSQPQLQTQITCRAVKNLQMPCSHPGPMVLSLGFTCESPGEFLKTRISSRQPHPNSCIRISGAGAYREALLNQLSGYSNRLSVTGTQATGKTLQQPAQSILPVA